MQGNGHSQNVLCPCSVFWKKDLELSYLFPIFINMNVHMKTNIYRAKLNTYCCYEVYILKQNFVRKTWLFTQEPFLQELTFFKVIVKW